jgi:hypothetical protein
MNTMLSYDIHQPMRLLLVAGNLLYEHYNSFLSSMKYLVFMVQLYSRR